MKQRNKLDFRSKIYFSIFRKIIFFRKINDCDVEYYVNNFRLLKLPLPNSIKKLNKYNDDQKLINDEKIEVIKNKDCDKIIFIADKLAEKGGVETRLFKLFKALREKFNTEPVLICSQNSHKGLQGFCNIFLNFNAPNSFEYLLEFVKKVCPKSVEFQFKNPKIYLNLGRSFLDLKNICIVGCCIHSVLDCNAFELDEFDYQIVVSNRLRRQFKNAFVIENWVQVCANADRGATTLHLPPSLNDANGRALFISRIDKEKYPTLKNFVEICKYFKLSFDIAGPIILDKKTFLKKLKQLKVNERSFIGPIDTDTFIQSNKQKYLFIAGVGQVVLEAAAAGVPALVLTHLSNPFKSRFLTDDNFECLLSNNFTVKDEDSVDGNLDYFMKAINSGEFDKFICKKYIFLKCSEDVQLSKYINLINNIKRSSGV